MNEATLLPVTIIFYTGGGGEEGVGEEGVREENGWKKRNKGSQFSKHGRGREGRQREGRQREGRQREGRREEDVINCCLLVAKSATIQGSQHFLAMIAVLYKTMHCGTVIKVWNTWCEKSSAHAPTLLLSTLFDIR